MHIYFKHIDEYTNQAMAKSKGRLIYVAVIKLFLSFVCMAVSVAHEYYYIEVRYNYLSN